MDRSKETPSIQDAKRPIGWKAKRIVEHSWRHSEHHQFTGKIPSWLIVIFGAHLKFQQWINSKGEVFIDGFNW